MIKGWIAHYKTKPEISGDFDYYKIIFRFDGAVKKKTVEKTVEKAVEKIFSLIKADPHITQKQIIDKTGLTRRGVEWNLRKLKNEGRIKRVGPDKGGYWEVLS